MKTGTTIVWSSTQKNTGFVVDFGSSSPFTPDDAIVGGAKHPVSVTAMKAGCYKYSAGACISGEIQGMCGSGARGGHYSRCRHSLSMTLGDPNPELRLSPGIKRWS